MQGKTSTGAAHPLREHLFLECRAMAEHALTMGKAVPAATIQAIEFFEREIGRPAKQEDIEENGSKERKAFAIQDLTAAHATLSKMLEPAIPQSILLLFLAKQNGRMRSLGPVPLIRNLMLVAISCLLIFITVVLSPDINDQGASIFNSEGLPLLINMIFLLAAAGLGSSFTALYRANRYITKLTFDPNQEASYWIRFLLGLISGLILAIVISENAIQSDFLEAGILRPLLAILGGFSADLVFTFLNRMVETVRSLFEGNDKALIDMETEKEKTKLAGMAMNAQLKLAQRVIKAREGIGNGADPKEVKTKLDALLIDILPEGDPHASQGKS